MLRVEEMMVEMQTRNRQTLLEERLSKGADLLFDMEQRGDTGFEYGRWMDAWADLLTEYESLVAA
jgi:hypothetical protein